MLLLAVALIGCDEGVGLFGSADCPIGPGEEVLLAEVGIIKVWRYYDGMYAGYFGAAVVVTDVQGNPLKTKRVSWEVVGGDSPILLEDQTLTNSNGQTNVAMRFRLGA